MRGKIRTSNEWPMVAFVRLYLTELLPNDIEKYCIWIVIL